MHFSFSKRHEFQVGTEAGCRHTPAPRLTLSKEAAHVTCPFKGALP